MVKLRCDLTILIILCFGLAISFDNLIDKSKYTSYILSYINQQHASPSKDSLEQKLDNFQNLTQFNEGDINQIAYYFIICAYSADMDRSKCIYSILGTINHKLENESAERLNDQSIDSIKWFINSVLIPIYLDRGNDMFDEYAPTKYTSLHLHYISAIVANCAIYSNNDHDNGLITSLQTILDKLKEAKTNETLSEEQYKILIMSLIPSLEEITTHKFKK